MQQLIITKDNEGQRLNKFLGKYLDAAPQSFLYKMLRKKNIKINHQKANGNEILKEGDQVEIFMSDETIAEFRKDGKLPVFEHIHLIKKQTGKKNALADVDILYEDKDILIMNKPVGLLSQKATASDYSLNEKIVDYYQNQKHVDSLFTPSVCNRLDRNTSGIILAGMSLKGSRELSAMLKNRTIDKYYLTIVYGYVECTSVIKGFLTKKKSHNQVVIYKQKQEAVQAGVEKPAYIETEYEPLAYAEYKGKTFTLLKVKLITGKTHQIRAHLHSFEHPIVGDGKYGRKDVNLLMRKDFGLKHQLLHAYELTFPKIAEEEGLAKVSGKQFRADLPEQFFTIQKQLFREFNIDKGV